MMIDISGEWNIMTTSKKNELELQQLTKNFPKVLLDEKSKMRGTLVAQSIKCLALARHDPRVLGSSPILGSLLSGEPASPSPSATPPACALSLSLSNK